MSDTNIRFCQTMLQLARREAKQAGVPVPKRLTAMRSDKDWFFVEGEGMQGQYVIADNAYDAKAKFIFTLIQRSEGKQ